MNAIYAAESSFDGTTERAAGEAVAAGRAEPDLKGNFGVNVTWGKWHFGAAFDYRIGGQTFNRTLYDVQFGSPLYNLDRRALNPKYRRAFDGEPVRLQRFVERFDALNFSAVQVGYVFEAKAAGQALYAQSGPLSHGQQPLLLFGRRHAARNGLSVYADRHAVASGDFLTA